MVMAKRFGFVERKTGETDIKVRVNLDGAGDYKLDTGVPFFDHMLMALAKHGLLDLEVKAVGDLEIDAHHTVEDVGICLGRAFREAMGDKKGISRFGGVGSPWMSLAEAVVDNNFWSLMYLAGAKIGNLKRNWWRFSRLCLCGHPHLPGLRQGPPLCRGPVQGGGPGPAPGGGPGPGGEGCPFHQGLAVGGGEFLPGCYCGRANPGV